jgi:hypothetical protein
MGKISPFCRDAGRSAKKKGGDWVEGLSRVFDSAGVHTSVEEILDSSPA